MATRPETPVVSMMLAVPDTHTAMQWYARGRTPRRSHRAGSPDAVGHPLAGWVGRSLRASLVRRGSVAASRTPGRDAFVRCRASGAHRWGRLTSAADRASWSNRVTAHP